LERDDSRGRPIRDRRVSDKNFRALAGVGETATMSPHGLLIDNGSLEPASTWQLRKIADELQARLGWSVDPVSLAHSDKIPTDALAGKPAELFEAALDRLIRNGVMELVVTPLFIGSSHAITRHVPALIAERKKRHSTLRIKMASPLFVPGETRLGEVLADHVREQLSDNVRPRVAIVDHGSPARVVTEARDTVTNQVRELLGDRVNAVAACSMERRPGAEFDFNEPLLETLLSRSQWQVEPVIVGTMFIAPGRHAGPDGDIAQICRIARRGAVNDVKLTRVMGSHPKLLDILVDRVRDSRVVA